MRRVTAKKRTAAVEKKKRSDHCSRSTPIGRRHTNQTETQHNQRAATSSSTTHNWFIYTHLLFVVVGCRGACFARMIDASVAVPLCCWPSASPPIIIPPTHPPPPVAAMRVGQNAQRSHTCAPASQAVTLAATTVAARRAQSHCDCDCRSLAVPFPTAARRCRFRPRCSCGGRWSVELAKGDRECHLHGWMEWLSGMRGSHRGQSKPRPAAWRDTPTANGRVSRPTSAVIARLSKCRA
jgi:hypothetical protein